MASKRYSITPPPHRHPADLGEGRRNRHPRDPAVVCTGRQKVRNRLGSPYNSIPCIEPKQLTGAERVVGGTAWKLCLPDVAWEFDLLVVDEAGQLSLANLLAMARCARSILLVGDQQQLAQPSKTDHPGDAGQSCLNYLMGDDQAVVPLAAILTSLGADFDAAATRERVSQWYWCGVLGELYGGATETRFSNDLPEVIAWVEGKQEYPATVYEADFRPNRLDTLRTRNSAAYKGLFTLLLREHAKDFRTGQTIDESIFYDDAIDIHHIFPAAWCERMEIPTEQANSILNKTPLTARTNRVIGGGPPSVCLPKLERAYLKQQGKEDTGNEDLASAAMDILLERHRIDPQALRCDDFNHFYEKRRTGLLALISSVIGKRISDTIEDVDDEGNEIIEDEEP